MTQLFWPQILRSSMDTKLHVLGLRSYLWGCFPTNKTMVLFTGWSNFWGFPVSLSHVISRLRYIGLLKDQSWEQNRSILCYQEEQRR